MISKEELIDFEDEIAAIYATGAIKGPIHLNDPNQLNMLIRIFQDIQPDDYIFATWRNHASFLLKGVPKELVKQEILAGRSMGMQFPQYRAFCSSIVAGCVPIALGAAWALKNKQSTSRVYCQIGDMAAMCGVVTEAMRYAYNHQLPLYWIIENNYKSVGTPTKEAWGQGFNIEELYALFEVIFSEYTDSPTGSEKWFREHVLYYEYEMAKPHSGIGKFLTF